MGGSGKSALAGRVAARLVEEGWVLAVRQGPLRLDDLALGLAEGLERWSRRLAHHRSPAQAAATAELVSRLRGAEGPEVRGVLAVALGEYPVLVVLDDFEQNLTPGGGTFKDEGVAAQLAALMQGATGSKLLLTCRYPVPGFEAHLAEVALPALSDAETRRLVLGLPGLRQLSDEERRDVTDSVGGHPRVLELVDALLRGGQGRLTVLPKLRSLAQDERIRMKDPARNLQDTLGDAVRMEARDIVLKDLLALLAPAELALLYQVAPSNLAMSPGELAGLIEASATTRLRSAVVAWWSCRC
jgi:hypothetical protein